MNEEILNEEKILRERLSKMVDTFTYNYIKANTKSRKNILSSDLLTISKICDDYFPMFKFKFAWDNDIDLYEETEISLYKFINNIIINQDKYFKVFNDTMYTMLSSKTINSYKYYGKTFPRHKEKELDYIFCDFLNHFDRNAYLEYVKLIERGNVFYAPLFGYEGVQHSFSLLKDNMIFVSSAYDNTISFYRTLSHEFGHTMETNLYLNNGKSREINNTFNSPFYEVSSSFMEYAYINYLLENNIYREEVKMLLYEYLRELLLNSIYANIISRIYPNNYMFDEELNIDINDFNTYLTTLEGNYNLYGLEKNKVSFRDQYIYGFGQLFSIYLYENYKKDPEYFKKEFNKALLEYSMTEDVSSFKRVGITYEELSKGDILKKVLTKNS